MKPFGIVWVRRDLRLHDNPALYEASQKKVPLLLLFTYSDSFLLGEAQLWWLVKSLETFPALVQLGKGEEVLPRLVHKHKPLFVYWNEGITPKEQEEDLKIAPLIKGAETKIFRGNTLLPLSTLCTKSGTPFKVFSPFWNTLKKAVDSIELYPKPRFETTTLGYKSAPLPKLPSWSEKFSRYWVPGETAALKKLHFFLEHNLSTYAKRRDYPSEEATSHLSPYLHFGEISVRTLFSSIPKSKNHEKFLQEIAFREFYHTLLYHFPHLVTHSFNPKFDAFKWNKKGALLKKWQRGETGYPIIDAAMRSLWETGFMHNRLRMIVASFLTKDLLIDWREGAKWFEETLLDADLANNRLGWQWAAGCGVDPAPYFRIFNPTTQSKTYDPEGAFIKKWLPSLAPLPPKYIHAPHLSPHPISSYPAPIVDHATARLLALSRYRTRD